MSHSHRTSPTNHFLRRSNEMKPDTSNATLFIVFKDRLSCSSRGCHEQLFCSRDPLRWHEDSVGRPTCRWLIIIKPQVTSFVTILFRVLPLEIQLTDHRTCLACLFSSLFFIDYLVPAMTSMTIPPNIPVGSIGAQSRLIGQLQCSAHEGHDTTHV